jgi:cytochrome c1
MVSIYTGNETGLSNWIKAPGKKREGPQMSGFPQLSDDELNEL